MSGPHERTKEISPLELLDKGAERIEREIKDPKIKARLFRTIANAYSGLGLGDKTQPLSESVG